MKVVELEQSGKLLEELGVLYIQEKERDKSGGQMIQRLRITMDLMACKNQTNGSR